jgi:hypothetical protein
MRLLAVALLAVISASAAWAGGPMILLRAAEFDPRVSVPAAPANLRAQAPAAGQQAHYIVQCIGPLLAASLRQMEAGGAKLLDYIPEFAFDVRATPEQVAQLAALPFVRWIGLMQPAYKLEPGLLQRTGTIDVVIRPYEDEDPQLVASAAVLLGARLVGRSSRSGGLVRVQAPAPVIAALAGVRSVSWIETWKPKRLLNNVARRIMNVSFAVGERPDGYDVWRNDGLFGAGEVVGVADTGLDTGDEATISPDFEGRIKALFTHSPDGHFWDLMGHGTHVTGSVLGNGAVSGSIPSAHDYTFSYAGVAPEAELVFQRIGADDSEALFTPTDLSDLFQQAYDAGARIHSNSWGYGGFFGQYIADSQSIDTFTWLHKDMVILFAAGNDGVDRTGKCGSPDGKIDGGTRDQASVTPPGTAKNCITVGASESERPEGNFTYARAWGYPAPPVSTDLIANNANGLAAFSSRGPTFDYRTKPDIVAPGTFIASVASQMLPGGGWYQFMSGTSMATPLTAGSAALVREYYRKIQRWSNPSAALIKATLMNCADEMAPGQYGVWANANCPAGGALQEIALRPNNDEGWGRVNVGACIMNKSQGGSIWYREGGSTRGVFSLDQIGGLTTGQSVELWFYVSDNTNPFRATLVWTDYPSYAGSSHNLVNDLDLEVRAPISATQNVDLFGHGDKATVQGETTRDRLNNAEEVTIRTPRPGNYRVRVSASSVPSVSLPKGGSQPFALIVSGSFANSLGISGAVTDEAGSVRRDVQMVLSGRTGVLASVYTDQFGEYDFTGLSPGTYTVKPIPKIGQPEFTPAQQTVKLPTGSGNAFGIDFVMTQGRTIEGFVGMPRLPTWAVEIVPIKDVVVTAASGTMRATAITNEKGYFQISNLTAGTWTVSCSRPAWYFHPPTQTVAFSSAWDLIRDLWFSGGTPEPKYTIIGEVRTKTGRLLPGVTFNISGAQRGNIGNVLSNSSGFYSKTGLLWDRYTITATMPGFLVHPILGGGQVGFGLNRIDSLLFVYNVRQDWFAEDRGLAVTNLVVGGIPRVRWTSPITVTIKNMSRALEQNITVNVYDNGVAVAPAQTIASLGGLTTHDFVFNWVPTTAGAHVIRAAVSRVVAEPYVGDNTRSVNITVVP